MNLTLILCIGIVLVAVICLAYFNRANRSLSKAHQQRMEELSGLIMLHKSQLFFRDTGLKKYNFLKYNLNEALIVQQEIVLH